VSWTASSCAANYRVVWKPSSSSGPATDAGLFAGTQCTLPGLPSGASITVGVSARNDSGETTVEEATIIVA
jgi:hypothetical protein